MPIEILSPPAAPARGEESRPAGLWPRLGRAAAILVVAVLLMLAVILGDVALPETRFAFQAVVAIALAVYAIYLVRRSEWLPRTPLDGAVLAILAACTLATATGLSPRLSLDWLAPLVAMNLLYYLAVETIRRGWLDTVYLPAILSFAAVIVFIVALELIGAYFGAGPLAADPAWFPAGGDLARPPLLFRAKQPLTNPNFLAALTVWLLPFGWLGLVRARARGGRLAAAALLAGLIAVLLATGSRGGLIGGLGGLAIAAGVAHVGPGIRWRRGAVVRMVALSVGVGLVAGLLSAAVGRPLLAGPSGRVELYDQAMEAFRAAPIAGIGPRNFPLFQARLPAGRQDVVIFITPHNTPLLIVAEAGVAGLAAGLTGLTALILAARRAWPVVDEWGRGALSAALGALAGILIHGLVDSFFFLPWLVLGLAFAAAIIAAPSSRVRRARARWVPVAAVALIAYTGLMFWLDLQFFWYTRGVMAANEGRPVEALALLDRAAALDPTYPATPLEWGIIAQTRNPVDPAVARRAVDRLNEGIDRLAPDESYRTRLAQARRAAGDPAGAAAELRSILSNGRPDVGTALVIARTLIDLGDRQGAGQATIAAVIGQPSLLGSGLWDTVPFDRTAVAAAAIAATAGEPLTRAQIEAFAGDRAAAAATLRAETATRPAAAWFGLGCLALGDDRPDEAIRAFVEAERARPGEPFLWAARGRALVQAGRVEEGTRLLRRSGWLLGVADEPEAAAILAADLKALTRPTPDGTPPAPVVRLTTDALLHTFINRVTVPRRIPIDPTLQVWPGGQAPLIWPYPEERQPRVNVQCPL